MRRLFYLKVSDGENPDVAVIIKGLKKVFSNLSALSVNSLGISLKESTFYMEH